MKTLIDILQQHQSEFACVLPFELQHGKAFVLDLTENSMQFPDFETVTAEALYAKTLDYMKANDAAIAIGRYAEDRSIYRRSRLFQNNDQQRSLHLGIDLTVAPGTPIFAPLDGIIHSFQDNQQHGDYGPTIILQHELDGEQFFTLYGHLDRDTLTNLKVGKIILKGEAFAKIGTIAENGQWPPHLHFQIIHDLGQHIGDYPGVAYPNEKDYYLANCPDPNLILLLV